MNSLILIPAFKDKAFEEEKEVRLQVFHDRSVATSGPLQFRNGAMGLTPYIEIPLKDPGTDEMTVVREVIVGPQYNQEEALRAVRQLLDQYGLMNVRVKPSEIPLRP